MTKSATSIAAAKVKERMSVLPKDVGLYRIGASPVYGECTTAALPWRCQSRGEWIGARSVILTGDRFDFRRDLGQ